MSAVTSLGLHKPIGLAYLIQEGLLPAEPSANDYTWESFASDEKNGLGDDELISTESCVVWCNGGVVRKAFRFEIEGESVAAAILTTFSAKYNETRTSRSTRPPRSTKQHDNAIDERPSLSSADVISDLQVKSKALVVFLKTQAHVYYLSGTSHVIHLPFEVEHVLAAPNGIIIQRRSNADRLYTASYKAPRVPQNSFISSQPQPWSAASSTQSNFSVASLGSVRQLNLPDNSFLGNIWETPKEKDDSSWPRLFSLTDPLADLGLVVTRANSSGAGKSSTKSVSLDPAEEIIYISVLKEFNSIHAQSAQPLTLAVTLNRVSSLYTVWTVGYIEQEDAVMQKPATKSRSASRRRSSFIPGSGATTPAVTGQYSFRESMGGAATVGGLRIGEDIKEEILDFATALDPDFEEKGVPRRKSRRVSSMVARADLSVSQGGSAYHELGASQNSNKRRGESLGSQYGRVSFGQGGVSHVPASQFGASINSLNSFLEAPVDDLLDELRAGGDFEGFHTMGLEDENFEGLRKEMNFSKVESVPIQPSNVQFSNQHTTALDRYRVFTLVAPRCASEDPRKCEVVVCILDKTDKSLVVLTLDTKVRIEQQQTKAHGRGDKHAKDSITIKLSTLKRAKRVLDACKLTDGDISRILILTESSDGHGDLTLQAPWSHLMKVELPPKMKISNVRSIGHDATPQKRREGGFRRVLSDGVRALKSLRNSGPGGIVDVVDENGQSHQIQISMEARQHSVKKIIDVCRSVLPGARSGEGILVAWWNVRHWLLRIEHPEPGDEWTALIIVLFCLMIGYQEQNTPSNTPAKKRKPRSHTRSNSQADDDSWQSMLLGEPSITSLQSISTTQTAWEWLEGVESLLSSPVPMSGRQTRQMSISHESEHKESELEIQIQLARDFLASEYGQAAMSEITDRLGYLPTARFRSLEFRANAVSDLLTGLHLFREEQKLEVATCNANGSGDLDLTPILAQLFRWVGWRKWVSVYDTENSTMSDLKFDNTKIADLPEPPNPPDIYQWIESCFVAKRLGSFVTIADITYSRSALGHQDSPHAEQWELLTPRTSLFMRFFSTILPNSSAADMIEALHNAGMTRYILESLPEAVTIPLRNSVVRCQAQPSASWDRELLDLVDREDVNLLLFPETHKQRVYSSTLAPTHEATLDVHGICSSTQDVETLGSFDGSAEVDRQAITRLIFKDDRRFNEAANILNTTKPKIARIEAQPEWSESDLLEAQKDHVQMLATRTLAIPTGRGLLFFSARIPLLTEKFPISGFNLHCIMKPSNNTVAVERSNFSEEKVCWAFFHSGVSAGLSISRAAKGIDTSWILYNKPTELSNRHAGFLLALGLNGHLKSVAKWVAFKYLTPKHTMTSIGLLLGLAVSYLGTMDSLITRLLSVHVTRMLPPGAAELNLSPLTQTSGIMGIGLLYCNTQHRRMSEIMLSEVEHIEPELEDEPLRNEGYRLAAGFALGFINLRKGNDLRGLHDLRIVERLLRVAVGSKKVDLVHILDKSTAAAIIAITLIFMKSENISLARKVDVPGSILQYDYVRPDMFLLRTLARHLIMWNEIKASPRWVRDMLPKPYQHKCDLAFVFELCSEDLPFYNILTGLLFSISLRHAGSGSPQVRDLMLHYLDQMSRICQLPAMDFDQKLTRTTVRNCLDLIALSASTVMAGTGDLATFRRLRALHGRDDADTPYGSHLSAHIAIGALFLGGGTHTFGTSDLAIGSLILSFYPLFPTNILDNKSHLQAFRHFWVLATEPRCLVARDLDTNRPVSVPLSITLKSGVQAAMHAPCLLPDLSIISTVKTNSQEYWNIVLDFGTDERVHKVFEKTQTLWVRRKQAHDSSMAVFQATLHALDANSSITSFAKAPQPLEWLFELAAFEGLTEAEQGLVLGPSDGAASTCMSMDTTVVDIRLILEKASLMSGKKDRLQGLKLLFAWKEACENRGEEMSWVRSSIIDGLKARVWLLEYENQIE